MGTEWEEVGRKNNIQNNKQYRLEYEKHLVAVTYASMLCYAKSLQSCPTLCDPIDGSPPGFPVPGILQTRILEWVAFPSPGDLPDPGIKLGSPAGRVFMV